MKTTTAGPTTDLINEGNVSWENDKWLMMWLEDNNNENEKNIEKILKSYQYNNVASHIASMFSDALVMKNNSESEENCFENIMKLSLDKLSPESRSKVLESLKKLTK